MHYFHRLYSIRYHNVLHNPQKTFNTCAIIFFQAVNGKIISQS